MYKQFESWFEKEKERLKKDETENKHFFYKPAFLLTVASFALLNNLDHSVNVYHSISKNQFDIEWLNWAQAIIVNVLIDIAVIAFVVNGRHWEAGIYAFFIFIINILYYDGLHWLEPLTIKRTAELVYSAMFTYSIYIFSFLYFQKLNGQAKKHDLLASLQVLYAKMQEADASIMLLNEKLEQESIEKASLKENLNEMDKELTELKLFRTKRLKELTCDCGYVAENDYAKSGHVKGCEIAKAKYKKATDSIKLSIEASPSITEA